MNFVKAHCGGNDFIILDTRVEGNKGSRVEWDKGSRGEDNLKEFVRQITRRRTGVGADGVIVIEVSDIADFGVRYFNPDGSEYNVCGNGSLCVLVYEGKERVTFSTGAGTINGTLIDSRAKVIVPSPNEVRLSFTLDISPCCPEVTPDSQMSFVDIGVPHTVVIVDAVNNIDINKVAQAIRFHPYFGKYGTNVNFMQIINKNEIAVRSYERGIEGETYSCGSGSCACAVVGWLNGILFSPIELKTKGGDFKIYIEGLDEIWLEGSPKIVYEGRYK